MAIVNATQLKLRLGIAFTDTSEDAALSSLLGQVQALAEAHMGRPIEQAIRTDYLEGTGRPWLLLPCTPVRLVQTTGTATLNSTTLSSLGTTTGIIAGMPVCDSRGLVPAGATVSSVSTSSVVISSAATAAGTGVTFYFGLSVWLDDSDQGQQAPDAYDAGALLTLGDDYNLRMDGHGALQGYSKSGLLYRSAGNWPLPRWKLQPGSLAPWVGGPIKDGGQCVKAVYAGGFAPGDVPADLQLAILDACALARQAAPEGLMKTSESFDGWSHSLGALAGAGWLGYLAGGGASAVNRYRRLPV